MPESPKIGRPTSANSDRSDGAWAITVKEKGHDCAKRRKTARKKKTAHRSGSQPAPCSRVHNRLFPHEELSSISGFLRKYNSSVCHLTRLRCVAIHKMLFDHRRNVSLRVSSTLGEDQGFLNETSLKKTQCPSCRNPRSENEWNCVRRTVTTLDALRALRASRSVLGRARLLLLSENEGVVQETQKTTQTHGVAIHELLLVKSQDQEEKRARSREQKVDAMQRSSFRTGTAELLDELWKRARTQH